jgi:hypothetical protein
VTPAVGLSATTPALTLYNPINSTVNLVLWALEVAPTTAQAALTAVMLAYNGVNLAGAATAPASVTNANITNAVLALGTSGSATAVTTQGAQGQCYRVATLSAAPIAFRYSMVLGYSSAVGTYLAVCRDPIDGAIVIPPGVAISVQAAAATPIVASFVWEEISWTY